jgi:hypothetical protein
MGRQAKARPGEKRRGNGWTAWAREGGIGKVKRKQFDDASTWLEREAWRASIKGSGPTKPAAGSFAADVAEYLSRITAMKVYKARAKYLELWMDALGRDRRRSSITATEIDRVLQHWLTTPTAPEPGKPGRRSGPDGLSGDAVRLRRTALLQVWVTLDGKGQPNPVRASRLPPTKKPELRALDYPVIARILEAMTPRHNGRPALTRVRAAVMAYTGLPPALIMTIRQGRDLHLEATQPWVRVEARQKGGGVEARTLKLTPQGRLAFLAFDAANAYGRFVPQAVNEAFQLGMQRAGIAAGSATQYALRHSFGAQVYRLTKDQATVGRLLVHVPNSRATARYVAAANVDVDAAAVAAFGASLETMPNLTPAGGFGTAAGAKVIRKVTRVRKLRLVS